MALDAQAEPPKISSISSKVCARIFGASLDPSAWPKLLETLCSLTGASLAALIDSHQATGEQLVHSSPPLPPQTEPEPALGFSPRARFENRASAKLYGPNPEIVSGIIGLSARSTDQVFRFRALCGTVEDLGNRSRYLLVYRPVELPDFEPEAISRFTAAVHGVVTARRCLDQPDGVMILARESMAAVIQQFAEPVIVVDETARPLVLNEAARQLLSDGRVLRRDGGRIAPAQPEQAPVFSAVLQKTLQGDAAALTDWNAGRLLLGAAPQPRRLVQVERLDPQAALGLGALLGAATIRVSGSDGRLERLEADLARFFHLTDAEARLAALLMAGMRLADAAEQLAMSVNTAKTHVKRVYSKTGTQRQAELILMVAKAGLGFP